MQSIACRCHEDQHGQEQWWILPIAGPLGPRSLLLHPLPQLRFRHLTHCVFLSRPPPSHICRGEEAGLGDAGRYTMSMVVGIMDVSMLCM